MTALGRVRVGHKAPNFQCEAVVNGVMQDVTLNTYIRGSSEASPPDPCSSWLILLFIPAAFSFVCPTEVLAFQNCLDEFKDRNCTVVFVSVDTKHSLWHWQNVPRQYGGLGPIDIPLLSDVTHRMSKDYGVLIEEEGVTLRGMFIIDAEGIVQQITLNNLTVGRSVLEALRLLEAFQAVDKHGVLCPIDWKPSESASDTISTISNTITESYEDRLANLQKEFGGVRVTDLDAKLGHGHGEDHKLAHAKEKDDYKSTGTRAFRSNSNPQPTTPRGPAHGRHMSTSPRSDNKHDHESHATTPSNSMSSSSSYAARSSSAPPSSSVTPAPTPSTAHPPATTRFTPATTKRPSRGTKSSSHLNMDQRYVNNLFSTVSSHSSIFSNTLKRMPQPTNSLPGHAPVQPTPPAGAMLATASSHLAAAAKHNTYESRRGSHVVLEFADPISSPRASPETLPSHGLSPLPQPRSLSQTTSRTSSPAPSRGASYTRSNGWVKTSPGSSKQGAGLPTAPSQTRLQATFEAIKKMSAGLASPKVDYSPSKKIGAKPGGASEAARTPGYFDVVVEGMET